jgi:hypothetical protein
MSERWYNIALYYYVHLKQRQNPGILHLAHPSTFNEKTIWLKMHYRHPDAHLLADKVGAKQYVRERAGSEYLVPTLGVYETADEIDFDALPRAFVLKANHGSGWNIICPDKARLDVASARRKLTQWLATSYYSIGKEYQYRDIERRIICEPYLSGADGAPLADYKVFCFGGVAHYVQVDLDRFTNHTRNFYDRQWRLVPFTTLYPMGTGRLPKPARLDEMLHLAEVLAKGLPFARVDLYYNDDRIYFGEITLHHGGGFEPFIPRRYGAALGALIDLGGVQWRA